MKAGRRLVFLFATLLFQACAPAPGSERSPATDLAVFDRAVIDLLVKWKMPGASLAVVRAGRLVRARGYGNSRPANRDAFVDDLDKGLWRAARQVTRWPDHDLFGEFP